MIGGGGEGGVGVGTQARSQDFRGGRGALGQWKCKVLRGSGGIAPPGKFKKIWSALDCILHVLMVDKERNRI